MAPTSDGVWFDGYEGQKDVIIDDMVPDCMAVGLFLRLFDRYPMSVPIKGAFVNWNPRRVFITSNFCPGDCGFGSDACMRRIDGLFEMN